MANKENLSSTQKKVKVPRPCVYSGDHKNTDVELARNIIILYVACKLGYTPIRHILGLPNDKKIEDVIRQHMLGRNKVDGSIGELYCPGTSNLEETYLSLIEEISKRYGTFNTDPYVKEMILTGKCPSDKKYDPNMCECGKKLQDEWVACPFCGRKKPEKSKKLF